MKRDLILIGTAMFAWGVGEGLFIYFQPIYLEQLGADPIMIGTISRLVTWLIGLGANP
jgi:hypothetical protein